MGDEPHLGGSGGRTTGHVHAPMSGALAVVRARGWALF